MDAQDLVDQLDELGISLEEAARLTGEPEDWFARLVKGEAPVPRWLDLLTVYWSTFPNALDMAREAADPARVGTS